MGGRDWRRLMWSVGKQKHKRKGSVYAVAEVHKLSRAALSRLPCKTFHSLGSSKTVYVLSATIVPDDAHTWRDGL